MSSHEVPDGGVGPPGGAGAGDSSRADPARSEAVSPKDLKVQIKEQRLIVEWRDGKRSEYSLALLRRHCPCATCRTERQAQAENPLQVLKTDPTGVRVTQARLVGTYAIQFFWSDGHSTGIFEFSHLRSLDTA
ncbi:MAG: DUF971 domain-containing protein [Phycisphaerae bacterium]